MRASQQAQKPYAEWRNNTGRKNKMKTLTITTTNEQGARSTTHCNYSEIFIFLLEV